MKFKHLLLVSLGTMSILVGVGYWYVFVANVPQFDAPVVAANPDLPFQLESFNSRAIGTSRLYGVILPPGYHQHQHQRYPVITALSNCERSSVLGNGRNFLWRLGRV